MGFSIRSELASYARLKRRCYFLFVISYGGLLAGLTYAAMTHQSPPLWIGLIPGPPSPSLCSCCPRKAGFPAFSHVLLGVCLRPHHLCRREADLSLIEAVELGAVAGLALIYPFYILCSTLEKEGTLKKYARIRGGRAPKRRRNEVRRPLQPPQLEPCSKPFRLPKNQASPRARAVLRSYGGRAAESGEE